MKPFEEQHRLGRGKKVEMAREIHGKRTDEGMEFRIWSTNSDSYVTGPMSEAEARVYLRDEAIQDALQQFELEIDGRFERVRTHGTSWYNDNRSLNDWNEERPEEGDAIIDADFGN